MEKEMSKVKIYTWADKAPEFIYKQYETLKRFVKDEDWEFIVFNNVPFPKVDRQKKIKKICKELGIKCLDVRFRSFVSGASYITAYGITWAYHRFFRWQKDTIQVLLDSDMVLLKDINFEEYLADNDICAIHQQRQHVDYLWNGFIVMRAAKLPDKFFIKFGCKKIDGNSTDTGGKLYYWLKRNPNLKIKYVPHIRLLDDSKLPILPENFRKDYDLDFGFEFIEDFILHYRAGSN